MIITKLKITLENGENGYIMMEEIEVHDNEYYIDFVKRYYPELKFNKIQRYE